MEALVIKTADQKVLKLLAEIAKQLGATVEKAEKSIYDPKFVAKIKKADEDIKHGRTKKIAIADLWK